MGDKSMDGAEVKKISPSAAISGLQSKEKIILDQIIINT